MTVTPVEIPEEKKLQAFRDDLREPKVTFGRCAITGEWGKVAAIDLGDISINVPNIEDGVLYDTETQAVTFTKARPVIFQNQALLSKAGLEKLIAYMDDQNNPIPAVTPELIYRWQVTYTDGTALSQFRTIPGTNDDEEIISSEIDFTRIAQMSVIPNFPSIPRAEGLPTYTFVRETGQIYRSGELLDLLFDNNYIPDSEVIYARKVNITFGSGMVPNSLDRNIVAAHTSVLQLLGWKVGGLHGPGPGCIIAIDERGNWRPYEYIEE
jgi:hypothetical protein